MRYTISIPHTVSYRHVSIPYRTVSRYFWLSMYRLVSRRDGSIRYGIGTAYRRSLDRIFFNLDQRCTTDRVQIIVETSRKISSDRLCIVEHKQEAVNNVSTRGERRSISPCDYHTIDSSFYRQYISNRRLRDHMIFERPFVRLFENYNLSLFSLLELCGRWTNTSATTPPD